MKNYRAKSQSINVLNSSKFKENFLNLVNPGIKEEYEIEIKVLVKNLKKQQKLKKIENNENKDNENNFLTNIDLNIIQYVINKKKRSSDELLIIKTFLSKMEFLSTLKTGSTTKDKLLFSLSHYVKIEKKAQNNILFRYGNKGNKFYFIFSGELSVLILKETKVKISYIRYFMHLIILKLLKEDDLLYKIILSNLGIDKVSKSDFDYYYENINKFVNKYFGKFNSKNRYFIYKDNNNINNNGLKRINTISLNSIFSNAINDIDILIDSEASSFEEENEQEKNENNSSILNKEQDKNEVEFDAEQYERLRRKKEKRREIFRKNPFLLKIYNINKNLNYSEIPIIDMEKKKLEFIVLYFIFCREVILSKKNFASTNEYINYTYLNSPMHFSFDFENYFVEKEDFNLFQYFEITKLRKGDSFGELALQHQDNKRTATIMTLTDSVLGYLSKNDYDLSLSDIELRKRKKNVNFILSFPIFTQMNWFVFENKYFNFFKKEVFNRGQSIMIQGQKNTKLYFIMDGQFEITTSMNLKDIYSILRIKMGKNFDIEQHPRHSKNFNFRIYISYNKDILGLNDCYYYNGNSFINATCISLKSVVFSVEISILNELREKNPGIVDDLKNMIEKKNRIMIERLKIMYYKTIRILDYFKFKQSISTAPNTKKNYLKRSEENDCLVYNNRLQEKEVDLNNDIKNKTNTPTFSIPNLNLNSLKLIAKKNNNLYNSSDGYYKSREKSSKREHSKSKLEFNNELVKNQIKIINNIKQEYGFASMNKLLYGKNKYRNENSKTNKIYKIIKEKNLPLSDKTKYIIKTSFNRVSNNPEAQKIIELNHPINEMINKEYSKLFNWIEDSINKNNSRYYNRFNTEEQLSHYYEKLINKNKRITKKIFQKEYSPKITSPIKTNRKKLLKLNSAQQKKFNEDTYNLTIENSQSKEKTKKKLLNSNKKTYNNTSTNKKSDYMNDIGYRERRLKRFFTKYIQNESYLERKINKKNIKSNIIKNSKCTIISNIQQNNYLNINRFPKVNFFLCSEITKKEFGLENRKLYFNQNILSQYYQNSANQNECFKLK